MITTTRLNLTLKSAEDAREMIQNLPDEVLRELSPEWLKLVESATEADPWIHGFSVESRSDGIAVGNCGFKGPPDDSGTVEIAYEITPEYQGRGFATEAARALAEFALQEGALQEGALQVIAHTLRDRNASTRVLEKSGFSWIGDVIDPDDGPVWRWEFVAQKEPTDSQSASGTG